MDFDEQKLKLYDLLKVEEHEQAVKAIEYEMSQPDFGITGKRRLKKPNHYPTIRK